MITPKSINQLFNAVGNAVSRVGVQGAISALENYELKGADYTSEFDFVMDIVSEEFDISKKDLIHGNSKKGGLRTSALECSAYILSEHVKIDRKIISDYLNKHISIISRYITAAKKYDPNHPFEKDKYNKFKSVEARILEELSKKQTLIN